MGCPLSVFHPALFPLSLLHPCQSFMALRHCLLKLSLSLTRTIQTLSLPPCQYSVPSLLPFHPFSRAKPVGTLLFCPSSSSGPQRLLWFTNWPCIAPSKDWLSVSSIHVYMLIPLKASMLMLWLDGNVPYMWSHHHLSSDSSSWSLLNKFLPQSIYMDNYLLISLACKFSFLCKEKSLNSLWCKIVKTLWHVIMVNYRIIRELRFSWWLTGIK